MNRRRVALFLSGLLALLVWQATLFRVAWPGTYTVKASSGLTYQDRFTYFLYYANLFPVASITSGRDYGFYLGKEDVQAEPNRLEYSEAAARRILREEGSTLVMEWGHVIRGGQLLTTYLFLPDAWRLGSPERAEIRMTHGALFIIALASVYVAAWSVGMPVFGAAFVLLVGSSPFQLYEAYRHENMFSWPITAFCFLLALALPLLSGRPLRPWQAFVIAIAAGLFTATVIQIRPEPIMVFAGVAAAFVAATSMTWRLRAGLVAAAIAALAIGTAAWNLYFDSKFEEASAVVARAGGHVLPGGPVRYHTFWQPIWCGLGDFDTKYGYEWNDSVAIAYAQPILEHRYGQELPWWWGVKGKDHLPRTAGDYEDAAGIYYKMPFHVPHYGEVLRDKVLGDIARDPRWYAGILARRLVRILSEVSPLQITLSASVAVPIPLSGLLVLPLAAAACLLRRWTDVRILLFSSTASLTALLVFSGLGVTRYSMYHFCALALAVAAVPDLARELRRRGRAAATAAIPQA